MLQLFTQMLFYYLPKKGAQKQRVLRRHNTLDPIIVIYYDSLLKF